MTVARLANQMRMQAALSQGLIGKPKQGLVTSYDPDHYAVKVKLQPEGIETGWLPIETPMSGVGWGVYFGPSNGDLATVVFLEGDREVGWCMGFLPNDADKPPKVLAGEMHLIHKGGSFLKFLADGKIHSHGAWEHDGTLHTTQDINCDTTVTATTDVVGGGKHLKTHTHSGVTAGAGNTGAPV